MSRLIEAGQAKKLITSHLGLNATVIGMMNRAEIEVEFYPQGILAEKIRAGGAGLFGILTDIGIDTILAQNKELTTVNGQRVLIEPALRADVALIHAAAVLFGNLVYEKSARNFNPAMATAAGTVIVETRDWRHPENWRRMRFTPPAALSTMWWCWTNYQTTTEFWSIMSYKEKIAKRAAAEIQDGQIINLGIGIPTLIPKYLAGKEQVLVHSRKRDTRYGPSLPARFGGP